MTVGDTFIWFPPNGRKEHLFIVLTDPAKKGGKFAAVNLTRSLGGVHALTLQIGDHPFVSKYPSDVNFGDAMIFDLQRVSAAGGIPQAPLNPDLVRRIAETAVGHPAIAEEVEDLIRLEWSL